AAGRTPPLRPGPRNWPARRTPHPALPAVALPRVRGRPTAAPKLVVARWTGSGKNLAEPSRPPLAGPPDLTSRERAGAGSRDRELSFPLPARSEAPAEASPRRIGTGAGRSPASPNRRRAASAPGGRAPGEDRAPVVAMRSV